MLRIVYPELRRVAQAVMRRERDTHTLQPTALVNEAFLRLFDGKPVPWEHTDDFLRVAAVEMRRIVTDYARRANAQKRQCRAESFPKDVPAFDIGLVNAMEIDRALSALALESPRAVAVVEMKYYAGLDNGEIAAVLAVTTRTVTREWAWAKAWLLRYLSRTSRAHVDSRPQVTS